LALGAWLATLGPFRGLPLFGYTAAMAVIFGASFLVPAVLYAAARTLDRPARRLLPVEHWLAVNNLSAAVSRLSISVAALAVSLSMMVAIAIMVGSFRETVVYWIGQTLQADLFISPGSRHRAGFDDSLSPDLVRRVADSHDVAAVDAYRGVELPYGDTGVRVGGLDLDAILTHDTVLFKTPVDARAAVRAAQGEDAVLASESFSLKHHLRPDDFVTLPTLAGARRFRIGAVYYDYSSDRGVLIMDRAVFERHYGTHSPSTLSVYLRDGVDPEEARERLLASIGDAHQVLINTNRSLRTEVLRIFDSTFAITYALELIAIAVAILGVSGTLLTLILEREQEFRILRLVGTARRQVRRMVVGEAILIGAISQAIGLVVGLALSTVLIYVINVQSFGWTIQFHLPVAFLAQSSLLMIVSTAVAGLYPASRAVRLTMEHDE
jgi:putative ABC transport system permease protein